MTTAVEFGKQEHSLDQCIGRGSSEKQNQKAI